MYNTHPKLCYKILGKKVRIILEILRYSVTEHLLQLVHRLLDACQSRPCCCRTKDHSVFWRSRQIVTLASQYIHRIHLRTPVNGAMNVSAQQLN